MNSILKRDRLIGLFCFIFAAYIWYEAGTFPASDFDAVGPSLYPRFLATIIGLASLVIFFKGNADEPTEKGQRPKYGSFLYVLFVSAVYIALLNTVGFIPMTIAFLVCMVLYFDSSELKIRVRNALVYAVLFSIFLYLFFAKLLGVLLPNGILQKLLG